MITSKAYTSRSNARRAGKGDPAWTGEITEVEGGFAYVIEEDAPAVDQVQDTLNFIAAQTEETAPSPELAKALDEAGVQPKAPRTPKPAHVAKSLVEKPVDLVHRLASEMFAADQNVTRKAILTACVANGVATHTAATQYARWRKNQNK